MNVFLIQAPLQVLNALEARRRFGLSAEACTAVWFRSASARNDRQTWELLRRGGWSHIHTVGYGGKSFRSWRQRFNQVNCAARRIGAAEHVFVGDYAFDLMRHFANRLSHGKLVVLDDGNSTVLIDRSRRDPAFPYYFLPRTIPGRAKHFLKTLCGMNAPLFERLTYFTVYDLSSDSRTEVIRNTYEELRTHLQSADCGEETFFLGACLSDKNLMSEEVYLRYLQRALGQLDHASTVYMAHRLEGPSKLAKVESRFGIEVRESTMPFECRLCLSASIPKLLAGFVTSAFDSCRLLCGDRVGIKSFYINPIDCVAKIRSEIEECYAQYERYRSGKFELVRSY